LQQIDLLTFVMESRLSARQGLRQALRGLFFFPHQSPASPKDWLP
jgi:hypothetical protein